MAQTLQALRSLFSWFDVSFYLSTKNIYNQESLKDSVGTKAVKGFQWDVWSKKENKEMYQSGSSPENSDYTSYFNRENLM